MAERLSALRSHLATGSAPAPPAPLPPTPPHPAPAPVARDGESDGATEILWDT